jgi:hypothetical protein
MATVQRSDARVREGFTSIVYDKDDKEDTAEFDGDDPYDGFRGLLKFADNIRAWSIRYTSGER